MLVTSGNVGMVVFKVLVWGVETLLGAGGDAVFKALIGEVDILPPAGGGGGGGEAVLDSFWEGLGFLPDNGAGAVFTELGLEVVVVFFDGEVAVFDADVFLVGSSRGGSGFPLFGLGLEGELDFFLAPAADILVVAGVVGVVAVMVGFAVVGV